MASQDVFARIGYLRIVEEPLKLKIVFFDVQSTGLGSGHEVIQLAAKSGNRQYSAYVMPKNRDLISEEVSELTGLFIVRNEMRDQYKNCDSVDALTKKEAATGFINFLNSFGEKVLLVGFNCFGFDGPMLSRLITEVNMADAFKNVVYGFSDALSIIKRKLRDRKEIEHGFKLCKLAKDYLREAHVASNSIFHVDWLQRLVHHPRINISDHEFIETSKITGNIMNNANENKRKHVLRKDLEILKVTVTDKSPPRFVGLDEETIEKFVEADIGLFDLYSKWKQGGREYVKDKMIQHLFDDEETVADILDNVETVFSDGLLSILTIATIARDLPFPFANIGDPLNNYHRELLSSF